MLASQVPLMAPTLTPSMLNLLNLLSMPYDADGSGSDTPYDWNYTVVPQTHMNGRTFPFSRGRLLGGSSSVSEWNMSWRLGGDLRGW